MSRYKNLSGHSGVVAYETTTNSITLTFTDGGRYLYTSVSVGRAALDRMIALAKAGRGLSTFVSQNVRENYERKL